MLLCAIVILNACKKDEPTEIFVSKITRCKTTMALLEEAKATLTATVLPVDARDRSNSWASGEVKVATVSTTGEVYVLKADSPTCAVSILVAFNAGTIANNR